MKNSQKTLITWSPQGLGGSWRQCPTSTSLLLCLAGGYLGQSPGQAWHSAVEPLHHPAVGTRLGWGVGDADQGQSKRQLTVISRSLQSGTLEPKEGSARGTQEPSILGGGSPWLLQTRGDPSSTPFSSGKWPGEDSPGTGTCAPSLHPLAQPFWNLLPRSRSVCE